MPQDSNGQWYMGTETHRFIIRTEIGSGKSQAACACGWTSAVVDDRIGDVRFLGEAHAAASDA